MNKKWIKNQKNWTESAEKARIRACFVVKKHEKKTLKVQILMKTCKGTVVEPIF